MRPLPSALFVDFDNLFLALEAREPVLAKRLIAEPEGWLRWLEQMLPAPMHRTRSWVVWRCYHSAARLSRRTAGFSRAGWVLLPCEPLTRQGKNAADIRLVIDVLDLVASETPVEELVLVSNDSDFTYLLLRLRALGRRTTIVTVGEVAAAYRAACDVAVELPEVLAGWRSEPGGPPARRGSASRGAPRTAQPQLWPRAAVPGSRAVPAVAAHDLVLALLAGSRAPLALPWLERRLREHLLGLDPGAGWFGQGSLRAWLRSLDLPGGALSEEGQGHLWSPGRHEEPDATAREANRLAQEAPELAELANLLHAQLGVPLLPPADYRALFKGIAAELRERGAGARPSAARVREQLRRAGHAVGVASVEFAVGELEGSAAFGALRDGDALARLFTRAITERCEAAGVTLTHEQGEQLRLWLVPGGAKLHARRK